MKRSFSDRRGYTLTELLLAAFFGLIVMAALYGFYRDQLFNLLSQETKTATLEDARGALDIMVTELRNAGWWGAGSAPAGCSRIVNATATEIHIQADLNADGDCDDATTEETGEDVTYDLLSAGTSTCPGPRIRRNTICLVANVETPLGPEKLFSYYDGNNTDLGDNPSDLEQIKRIKITFSIQETNPDPRTRSSNPYVTSTLSSSVIFRN